jgi:glucose-6-phosphate-specific signal transduction histidine kinase
MPAIEGAKLIALFRVVQEAFDMALQHESVTAIHLAANVTDDALSLELSDDGIPPASNSGRKISPAMASTIHRARDVGADIAIPTREAGKSVLRVAVPLAQPA